MSSWKHVEITTDNGKTVDAVSPYILSVSRSTDIPTSYMEWFIARLKAGYCSWRNPFNNQVSYVSFNDCRFVVFWSKNPATLLTTNVIDLLKERGIDFYLQYTLNDYFDDGLEPKLQLPDDRMDLFCKLSEKYGKERIIWRFDPLVLTNNITVDSLLNKVRYVGEYIHDYTEKLVFSFVDVKRYPKVVRNLNTGGVFYKEWTDEQMLEFGERLVELKQQKGWNIELATCCEPVDLAQFGISHNKCIDDELIARLAYNDKVLMDFLGMELHDASENLLDADVPAGAIDLGNGKYITRTRGNKDSGQREFCGCIVSKDIGQYNTCINGCKYCYANSDHGDALCNYKRWRVYRTRDRIVE